MAQQVNDPGSLSSTRYSESRAPQFTGGDVDVNSGNIVPATKATYSQAQPTPATPTTQLASIEPPSSSGPSLGQLAGNFATSLGTSLAAKGAASGLSGLLGGSKDNVGSPTGAGSFGSRPDPINSATSFGGDNPSAPAPTSAADTTQQALQNYSYNPPTLDTQPAAVTPVYVPPVSTSNDSFWSSWGGGGLDW